jgi:hypothetical protein
MDEKVLLELIMLALGKVQPGVSDQQAIVVGEQLANEILALLPPPAPVP